MTFQAIKMQTVLTYIMIASLFITSYQFIITEATNTAINAEDVTYDFYVDTTARRIEAGSTLRVTFPSGYDGLIDPSVTCDDSGNPTPTSLVCSATGRVINITNYFPSTINFGRFYFRILGVTNPPDTGATGNFLVEVINKTSQSIIISDNSGSITITEGEATCSVVSSSPIIGASSTYTLTITPSSDIPVSGGIQWTFPDWFGSIDYPESPTMTCEITDPPAYVRVSPSCVASGNVVTASNINTVLIPATTQLTFTVRLAKNPPTAAAVTFTIKTITSGGVGINVCTPAISVTQPNIITPTVTDWLQCIENGGDEQINTYDQCLLKFTITNPLKIGSEIEITFPDEVGIDQLNTFFIDKPRIDAALTYSSTLRVFRLTDAVQTDFPSGQDIEIRFRYMQHPSTTASTSSFQIVTFSDSSPVDERTIGLEYEPNPGSLPLTITATPPTVGSTSVIMTFEFFTSNDLTNGAEVHITFPNEIPITGGITCTATGSGGINSLPTCVVNSQSVTISSIITAAILAGGSEIEINLDGIDLPSTTQETQAFSVHTEDGGNVIDRNEDVTFQADPNEMDDRDDLEVQNNPTVYATDALFRISGRTKSELAANGRFTVYLPDDGSITINDQTTLRQNSELYIGAANPVISSVTFNLDSPPSFTIPNPSGVLTVPTNITLLIAGLRNPSSTAPTTSFVFQTETFQGYALDAISSGIGLTANQISPSIFDATATPAVFTTGQTNTYTVQFTVTIDHLSTDTISITFPTGFTFSSPKCQAISPVASAQTSCTTLGQRVSYTLGQALTAGQTFEYTITNVKNHRAASTYLLVATTANAAGFSRHSKTDVEVILSPSTITVATIERSVLTTNELSEYTFTFTPINTYTSTDYFEIEIPPSINWPTSVTVECFQNQGFASDPDCALPDPANEKLFRITNGNPTGGTSWSVRVQSLINPTSQVATQTFKIRAYNNAGNIIDQITSGLIIEPPCVSTCRTCEDDNPSNCLSCESSLTFDEVNLKCVSDCGVGTYETNDLPPICSACDDTCRTCSGPDDDECESCYTTGTRQFLDDGECLSSCPSGKYPNQSNKCTDCNSPCATCTSATTCTSCQNDLYLYDTGCVDPCPSGTFKDDSLFRCTSCKSNCVSCTAIDQCTSCESDGGFPYLYEGDCVSKCPDGSFQDGFDCPSCLSPCTTCNLTEAFCTSCEAGLYADQGNCYECQSPCATCSGAKDVCSSCTGSLFLQGTTCVSVCSDGYYADNSTKVCQPCKDPCVTCSGVGNCTSCDFNSELKYLYDGSCVETCPTEAPEIVERQCFSDRDAAIAAGLSYNPYSGLYLDGLPFPFIITSVIIILCMILIKAAAGETLARTATVGLISIVEWSTWVAFAILVSLSHDDGLPAHLGIAVFALFAHLIVSALYFFLCIRKYVLSSTQYKEWRIRKRSHKVTHIIFLIFSFISMKSFRIIYSKLFEKTFFSAQFNNFDRFHKKGLLFLFLELGFGVIFMLIAAIIGLSEDTELSQVQDISVEVLVISIPLALITCFEALRPERPNEERISPNDGGKAINVLEKSIMDKLNESQEGFRNDPKRSQSRLHAFKRRQSLNLDSDGGEFNSLDTSMNQGNSKRKGKYMDGVDSQHDASADDLFNQYAEGQNGQELSRIDAIEERDGEDEDNPGVRNLRNGKNQLPQSPGKEKEPASPFDQVDGNVDQTEFANREKNGFYQTPEKDGDASEMSNSANKLQKMYLLSELRNTIGTHPPKNKKDKMNSIDRAKSTSPKHLNKMGSRPNPDFEAMKEMEQYPPYEEEMNSNAPYKEDMNGGGDSTEEMDRRGGNPNSMAKSPSKHHIQNSDMDNDMVMVDGMAENGALPPVRGQYGQKGSPKKGGKINPNNGLAYESTESMASNDDQYAINEDTPSNYNILNQRFDDDFVVGPDGQKRDKMQNKLPKLKDSIYSMSRQSTMGGKTPSPMGKYERNNYMSNGGDDMSSGANLPPIEHGSGSKVLRGRQKSHDMGGLSHPKEDRSKSVNLPAVQRGGINRHKTPDPRGEQNGGGFLNRKGTKKSSQITSPDSGKLGQLEEIYLQRLEGPGSNSNSRRLPSIKKGDGVRYDGGSLARDDEDLEMNDFSGFENFVNNMKIPSQQTEDFRINSGTGLNSRNDISQQEL